jgi:methionyl-tRNA formyltransferase
MKDYLSGQFDVMTARPETQYLNIGCGEINSPEVRRHIEGLRPDVIAVLGSSVLRPEIIKLPEVAMINIHSGLSPYYRGTWSFGWPLVNREPQYIGVTVHHVNSGIDAGDIIYQTRPHLYESDDLNIIFLKVIAEGIELMVEAIEELVVTGNVPGHRQPRGAGRLYQMKDFNAQAARTCLKNLEEGLIGEYLSNREERDSKVKLFGYKPPSLFR